MWNSNGDIIGQTVEAVDPGDMHVTGRIDGNSRVRLRSSGGSITVDGRIDGSSIVHLVASTGSITIGGKIDGEAIVVLVSPKGTLTIGSKIDGSSTVTLECEGNISIGAQPGGDDPKIDGSSSVSLTSNSGTITLAGRIDGSSGVTITAAVGAINIDNRIDGSSTLHAFAGSNVLIGDKIDGSSRVEIVSNGGSVTINEKIDGNSVVTLSAGEGIGIGIGQSGGDEDHKIDGNCSVTAIAGGQIKLGSRIAKDRTTVDFAAGGPIMIMGDIGFDSKVRLLSVAGNITVVGGITGVGTRLITWPKGAASPQVTAGATWIEQEWAVPEALTPGPRQEGYWWENWPQSFGYVAPFRVVPRTVDDLVNAVIGTGTSDNPDLTPVKAVGGGWSFTDASLPFITPGEVERASLIKRGTWQRQDFRGVLQGLNDSYPTPFDPWPEAVTRSAATFTKYQQNAFLQVTQSGAQLPSSPKVRLIDTRTLASSLQSEFPSIRAAHPTQEILFHVEAGITMADLQQVLDHQHPRLALRATGASSGATLAGALSTATHGGEFNAPLLVDYVRAVHIVGPGGEQWWIEGDVPVADQANLQNRYPAIDPAHFIAAGWNGIPGLSSQDVLDAVIVSMGTMGVIYSMVISVVPQFGVHQVVHPTSWPELLAAAGTTVTALRAGDPAANEAVLNALMDGNLNGTGISRDKNEYIDLAINPLNLDCWVVNREITASPQDPNNASASIGDYLTAFTRALQQHSTDGIQTVSSGGTRTLQDTMWAGRVFDFLSWGTDLHNLLFNDPGNITGLLGILTASGNPLGTAMGIISAQAVLNKVNQSGNPDRGHQFLADVLSGLFHAMEGTEPGKNSDSTAVSHEVGATGWPANGLPGRGLEIALGPQNAFTFLQTVLFDDVLPNTIAAANQPLLGYISIRVCPKTNSLMGMQQYAPSVMIEVVAYRSPESNNVMDTIQQKAVTWAAIGPRPLLHWGLENDQVDHAFLVQTPLGATYKAGMTRLEAFKAVREALRHGHAPVFDNAFSNRIGV
ncbi:hypothetical protein [Alloacidobacterium sp.]|uniref:hypothetical protein n=1 Tax=Alloacidobacterium sp. TaxID=2951999 RepID=UPI002D4EBA9B|nr:hypothetical protein [Alloacidobacterium sp.]HYK36950.1 hypothetical protein [Alloacidobacterium sp.]